ncbi:MAG TPA: pyruvate dehydrogenase (acetyl-transferring), homodimeric type, partial [Actinoplanes sp.]|nr:pyruvate dehydrogenase (acetyl-transferring), homodimeric type [Actinoplanes sp.]
GTNPAVVQYDPAYGYEIRHIVRDGIERMYGDRSGRGLLNADRDPDVMYYLTVYNEPMLQPAEPADVDVEGILRGIHRVADGDDVQLLASGVAVPWALQARDILAAQWGVSAGVWSVTSWNELRRDAVEADRAALLDPSAPPRVPYLTRRLSGAGGPFVATSDYDRLVADQVRAWVPGDYAVLGADGFGLSDTRPAVRRHFLIDSHSLVVQALVMLARRGEADPGAPARAAAAYRLSDVNAGTTGVSGGEA